MIMIIIYISQRVEAIKPRQIINYDGRYRIEFDLHQLNVKTTSDNTPATLNTGQPHVNEEQNLQNNNLQHPSTKWIEQINIALEQKGSGNFSAWVIEACRRRLTSEKRAYTSIKSDEE